MPQYASELSLSHHSIGVLERDRGGPDAALAAFERARRIQEGLVKGHPDVAQFGRELARTHDDVGLIHHQERPAGGGAGRVRAGPRGLGRRW